VLSDDNARFPFNKHELSADARNELDQFVDKLKSDDKNVYLEIQGHTDSTGSSDYNARLGEERAEAVRLYLNQKGVALNRMATISYGETQPVDSNKTREGRAKNRRVVIIVLS
jgi:outer membrane protein OmpA-like peptidoglycan-associated protein